MLFDSHAHYYDKHFESDADDLLSSMKENGVGGILNAGCDVETTKKCIELSERYDFLYASAGIHPGHIQGPVSEAEFAEIERLALHPSVKAIGEIGLDYHFKPYDKEIQKNAFSRQVCMAAELNMPIIVHSREACRDTVDVLKSTYGGDGGIWHCFGESVETAKIALNMGLSFSIGGTVTFKNNVRAVEAVRYIPLDAILLETDSPYLAPTPHRGERNCSLYIHLVAEKIAEIKGVSKDMVIDVTDKNARRVFNIE